MKTSATYINEYYLSDSVIECVESVTAEVMSAAWDYENRKRDIELRSVLEGAETTAVLLEKEGQGVLASIGSAVMKLIHKVEEFLKKITDTLFGFVKKNKDDVEIVTKMLAQYPELRNQVCKGINEEWFTYKDIAAYEKDICGLITMLEKHSINHETFKDKINKALEKFNDSAAPLLKTTDTIGKLTKFVPDVHRHCSDSKKAVTSLTSMLKKFKSDVSKNYNEQEVGVARSILNALGQAIGICSKECDHRVRSCGKLSSFISKINNSALAKKLKLDDDSRDARRANRKDKYGTKQTNRYLQDRLSALRSEKDKAQREIDSLRNRGYTSASQEVKDATAKKEVINNNLKSVEVKLGLRPEGEDSSK